MNATLFDQWGGRESTKFDGTRPHACPEKGGTRSSLRGAWRAPREATSLARTCAVSTGRLPRSRSHAGGAGRRIWQLLGESRVEVRMKISNLEIWRAPRAPATGDTVGSCPAEKFARGPKIRAVQCSWGCRRGGGACGARRGSPGSRAHLLALGSRALQVPKKRRRHASRVGIDPTSAPRLRLVASSGCPSRHEVVRRPRLHLEGARGQGRSGATKGRRRTRVPIFAPSTRGAGAAHLHHH